MEDRRMINPETLRLRTVMPTLTVDDIETSIAFYRDRQKGIGFRLYCVTHQDVDKVASDIKVRGGNLDHDPVDQPWGTRDFAVSHPDGFKISISTPMPS